MTPIPYDGTSHGEPTVQFACPNCSSNLPQTGGAVVCPECGFVPRQGAD